MTTKKNPFISEQLHELLYQALETENGGIRIYQTALSCALNADLKADWEECLEQTRTHEKVLLQVFKEIGLNPDIETPGRKVVGQEEDHHLYHAKGFTRELWMESLGLPAVLPPPEETKDVETEIGAARAENAREDILKTRR